MAAFNICRRPPSRPHNLPLVGFLSKRKSTVISSHYYANRQSRNNINRPLSVYSDKEADIADIVEQIVGGERYEMSELPDSMMDTTLFVGNLNEFVNDNDLSELFQSVSTLQSVPACVVRKADTTSRQYGFVSFPTVEEKEAAILRFHNYQWRGHSLRVEAIKDHPTAGRVRLPERMISYVSGPIKSTRINNNHHNNSKKPMNSLRRISRDDVERLSRGQPAKRKGYGSRAVPHRLNDLERAELNRAQKKGFVSLLGGGNRRTRKGSPLANIFRQWCDAREKPQIILYKSTGSESKQPLDRVLVDLSPLRLLGSNTDMNEAEDILNMYKGDIETAAFNAGMKVCSARNQDDDDVDNDDDNDDSNEGEDYDDDNDDNDGEVTQVMMDASDATARQQAWATRPMWQLPVQVAGEYEGDRPQAKAMAKELSIMWEIAEEENARLVVEHNNNAVGPQSRRAAGAKQGGRDKMKGLSHHRKRGGGHRQSWY
ncbi:hypothetical protein ACA910_000644 [Epithemia clementina (nom. ined.)]